MIKPAFKLERVEIRAKKMLKEADRANVRALFKISAFTARTARRSMRKRKRASAPGQPPSAHSGDRYGRGELLRQLMEFSVDRKRLTAVIGPRKIRSKTLGKVRARKPVPNLHEFGGSLRVDGDKPGQTRRAIYPARPYMAPALDKARESDKLRDAWRDSFGGRLG